jgi:hypothetical protein
VPFEAAEGNPRPHLSGIWPGRGRVRGSRPQCVLCRLASRAGRRPGFERTHPAQGSRAPRRALESLHRGKVGPRVSPDQFADSVLSTPDLAQGEVWLWPARIAAQGSREVRRGCRRTSRFLPLLPGTRYLHHPRLTALGTPTSDKRVRSAKCPPELSPFYLAHRPMHLGAANGDSEKTRLRSLGLQVDPTT